MKLGKLINLIEKLNNEKRNLFFSFSGHVDNFDIRIFREGWKENEKPGFNKTFYNNPKEIKKAYLEVIENV
jgi:hypothetical protein